jgi:hypothetical protein
MHQEVGTCLLIQDSRVAFLQLYLQMLAWGGEFRGRDAKECPHLKHLYFQEHQLERTRYKVGRHDRYLHSEIDHPGCSLPATMQGNPSSMCRFEDYPSDKEFMQRYFYVPRFGICITS